MSQNRRNDIVDILYEKERVSVAELAETLFVSEMTIRRDLIEMEKEGILKRYRGGAVLSATDNEMPISKRFYVEEKEKKFLAKAAGEFLSDNLTVYIYRTSADIRT